MVTGNEGQHIHPVQVTTACTITYKYQTHMTAHQTTSCSHLYSHNTYKTAKLSSSSHPIIIRLVTRAHKKCAFDMCSKLINKRIKSFHRNI